VKAILAMDSRGGIGLNDELPWPYNKQDMRNFLDFTKGGTLIMGSRTWESLPEQDGVRLPGRDCYVLTSYKNRGNVRGNYTGLIHSKNEVDGIVSPEELICIGGAETFRLFASFITSVRLTRLNDSFNCDTFIPAELHCNLAEGIHKNIKIYENMTICDIDIQQRSDK